MIEIHQLTKHYGNILAVNNLSLSIPAGQVFGFIGPNGAGKTTTIRMMGGIIEPTSGFVTICGINMNEQPEKAKSKIGFIPDRPYLYEKITAMEFLRFTAELYGFDGDGFYNIGSTASGNLRVTDAESGLAIAKGNVVGTGFIHKFGNAPDFDTTDGEVTIWDGAEDRARHCPCGY